MSESTQTRRKGKHQKPSPDFPLTPHPSGRWCKRVKGVLRYFGPIGNPQAALDEWLRQKDYLLAGRTPPIKGDGLTVLDLCNHFMTSRKHKLDAGELRPRTWHDYDMCCRRLQAALGKHRQVAGLVAQDFTDLRAELAKTRGPVALGNEIQRVRSVFKYAYEAGLVENPVRFGPDFAKPSRKSMRLAKAKRPARMFEAAEIRQILAVAESRPKLKAMVLLAVNCGFGNFDVSELPISALDLQRGIVDFVRPKTGVPRRAVLWPETVAALRQVLADRPKPKDPADAGLVFITVQGGRFVTGKSTDGVGLEFGKLLRKLKMKVDGRNFYSLRHVHRTISDECNDQPAADLVMGHLDGDDIRTHYRERISDDRLRQIAAHVHDWLFPPIAAGEDFRAD